MSALYVVESRTRAASGGWTDWATDGIGDNEPRNLAECEQDCRALPAMGEEWAAAEYRVRTAICTVHDVDDVVPGRICGHALPCPEHP